MDKVWYLSLSYKDQKNPPGRIKYQPKTKTANNRNRFSHSHAFHRCNRYSQLMEGLEAVKRRVLSRMKHWVEEPTGILLTHKAGGFAIAKRQRELGECKTYWSTPGSIDEDCIRRCAAWREFGVKVVISSPPLSGRRFWMSGSDLTLPMVGL